MTYYFSISFYVTQYRSLCPKGFYCALASTKEPCPLGHICPGGNTSPEKCTGLTIANDTMMTECIPCVSGTAPDFTHSKCEACGQKEGYTCTEGGIERKCRAEFYCPTATEEIPCELGMYCPEGSFKEELCPSGFECATTSLRKPCSIGSYCATGTIEEKPVS